MKKFNKPRAKRPKPVKKKRQSTLPTEGSEKKEVIEVVTAQERDLMDFLKSMTRRVKDDKVD